jgi:hypothetical protein
VDECGGVAGSAAAWSCALVTWGWLEVGRGESRLGRWVTGPFYAHDRPSLSRWASSPSMRRRSRLISAAASRAMRAVSWRDGSQIPTSAATARAYSLGMMSRFARDMAAFLLHFGSRPWLPSSKFDPATSRDQPTTTCSQPHIGGTVVTHLKPGLTVDARGIPTASGAARTSTAVLRVQRRLNLARS